MAGSADGARPGKENFIIAPSKGWVTTPVPQTTIKLRDNVDAVTEFMRRGDVYVMDAWIPKDSASPSERVNNAHVQMQDRL